MFYYVFLFGIFIVWQNFSDALLPRPTPDPRSCRSERLSRIPEFSVDLLSGSVRTTITLRVSRYNGHLPADGLRNNRIRLYRLSNAYHI
jgi:hypothetical protein